MEKDDITELNELLIAWRARKLRMRNALPEIALLIVSLGFLAAGMLLAGYQGPLV